MTWTDNYLDVTANLFSDMHVIIEGAIALFENDTGPIVHLCTGNKEIEARTAFNGIGSALYNLRGHITRL